MANISDCPGQLWQPIASSLCAHRALCDTATGSLQSHLQLSLQDRA